MEALTLARFALAIVFDALAFVVWDVGTRSPVRLARDVVRTLRTPRWLLRGLLRFATGLALIVLAGLVLKPALPTFNAFTVAQTGVVIAALIVEALIGPDLRRTGRKKEMRRT
ncbi:MAG: hypothetical protein JOZ24_12930 [Candidatus Eremiobacteraeota bacterium]|nr:hypothetical protein [Candidatus Eremiobacteraeota bacterium]